MKITVLKILLISLIVFNQATISSVEASPKNSTESETNKNLDRQIESHLMKIWNTFKNSILKKDFETALNLLVPGKQDQYREIFADPKYQIVTSFKEIERIEIFEITERTAEAGVIRKENKTEYAYPLTFIKDVYGEWKIYQF